MNAGTTEPSASAPRGAAERIDDWSPIPVTLVAFGCCALLWFASDFGGVLGPCAGPYDERASLAVSAALGPLSVLWNGPNASSELPWVLAATVAGVAVVGAYLRRRENAWLRLLAYLTIFCWLGIGCLWPAAWLA